MTVSYNRYNPCAGYLMHYGVKGQQKGVRKYQNPDGTWTELGKERRRKQLAKDQRYNESGAGGKASIIAERSKGTLTAIGGIHAAIGALANVAASSTALGALYSTGQVAAMAALSATGAGLVGAASVALVATGAQFVGHVIENKRREALGEEKMTWNDKQYYEKHKDRYADK